MDEEEFIYRELQKMDVSPETADHLEALEMEDILHPNEEAFARSQRLLRESLPAVWFKLMDLATCSDSPAVRQEARAVMTGVFMSFAEHRGERDQT